MVHIGPGRPTLRTAENRRRILAALQRGALYRTAAAAAGMSGECFRAWRADEDEFSVECERAKAQSVLTPMDKVVEVMRNEPVPRKRNGKDVMLRPYSEAEQLRMIRWFLEHRSDEFKTERVDLARIAAESTDETAKQIAVIIDAMDDNVLNRDGFGTTNGVSRN